MTGETPNPLHVLQDRLDRDGWLDDPDDDGETATALSQVAALAEAAQAVTFAIWENDESEQQAAERFRAALVPFAARENTND